MAKLTARRRAWAAVGIVTGVTALSTGAWALHEWKPFAHPSSTPSWPPSVAPLARYVEDTAHVRFTSRVNVEFIADADAFVARVEPDAKPSEAALRTAATDEAVGRALGFWTGEPHLADGSHLLRTSSDSGVEWLPDDNTVVVRAKDGKATLSPIDRADLVLVLTEIVDDQRYRLADRMDAAPTPQAFQVLAGMSIGEALWVHDRYVDRFNGDDVDAYRAALTERSAAFGHAVASVNTVFRTLRVASQTVGAAFIATLHRAAGPHGVARAFTSDVPEAIDQMSLPVHKFFEVDPLEHVDAPPVPSDAEYVYTRQMGPFGVHLVLAGGLDPAEALAASDGWGNDSFVAYRLDNRICVDARIVADDAVAADRIERGLQAWGARRPAASDALVGRHGTTLLLSVCDPGANTAQPTVDAPAADQFLGRADLLRDQVTATGQAGMAECVAMGFFRGRLAADLRGENSDVDPVAEIDLIGHECHTSV
jgi:hypothetical protein